MSERTRAYYRLIGNPYAFLQLEDASDERTVAVQDLESEYIRQLENPYASLSIRAGGEDNMARVTAPKAAPPALRRMSKVEFRSQCRRIFRQYIPDLEKGRLRLHHRDFISRNESRSPEIRNDLVSHLRKYDLSQISGVSGQFNRERQALTEEKLRAIERLVGID